jgi:hypothetical protein
MFGLDITNHPPIMPTEPKKSRAKKGKPSLSTEWLHSLPEVHPYLSEIQQHTRTQ